MNKERLIPLIVATALFMENMDSTVIATSLPAIAADIGTSPPQALTLMVSVFSENGTPSSLPYTCTGR